MTRPHGHLRRLIRERLFERRAWRRWRTLQELLGIKV
jgi:hypothetical protein